MEVVLIRPGYAPPVEFRGVTSESRLPTGLLYLAAPLVARGIGVAIIDQSVERNWEERLLREVG